MRGQLHNGREKNLGTSVYLSGRPVTPPLNFHPSPSHSTSNHRRVGGALNKESRSMRMRDLFTVYAMDDETVL